MTMINPSYLTSKQRAGSALAQRLLFAVYCYRCRRTSSSRHRRNRLCYSRSRPYGSQQPRGLVFVLILRRVRVRIASPCYV